MQVQPEWIYALAAVLTFIVARIEMGVRAIVRMELRFQKLELGQEAERDEARSWRGEFGGRLSAVESRSGANRRCN